jgi:hypothetical protein
MGRIVLPPEREDLKDSAGCAYVLDEPGGPRKCGAPRRQASSYCARHHALCYIISGSKAEFQKLREVETLASAVGGRRARQAAGPSRQFLKRLEQAVNDDS